MYVRRIDCDPDSRVNQITRSLRGIVVDLCSKSSCLNFLSERVVVFDQFCRSIPEMFLRGSSSFMLLRYFIYLAWSGVFLLLFPKLVPDLFRGQQLK